jgi:hypothetical protein
MVERSGVVATAAYSVEVCWYKNLIRTSVSNEVFPAPLVPRRRNVGVAALLPDAR